MAGASYMTRYGCLRIHTIFRRNSDQEEGAVVASVDFGCHVKVSLPECSLL